VLCALCRELAAPQPPALPTQLHRIRAFYGPLCEGRYDHVAARLRDLEQLEQLAAGFADRSSFLGELTLEPPRSTQDLAGSPSLDEDHLVLSTIHSAKGLEFDAVYVLHAADGNIPSDLTTGSPEEIDEELRLFYVALSRARRHLSVTFPLRWFDRPAGLGGRHALAQLTRFLPPRSRRRSSCGRRFPPPGRRPPRGGRLPPPRGEDRAPLPLELMGRLFTGS
jgi:DNA helicase-2/ATP-dependent DNA helicase PcrA